MLVEFTLAILVVISLKIWDCWAVHSRKGVPLSIKPINFQRFFLLLGGKTEWGYFFIFLQQPFFKDF